jgi:hypothetical protein
MRQAQLLPMRHAMQRRIESHKLHLEPWQGAPELNVAVNMENNDGSWSTAPQSPVLFERVAHQLEHLLGKSTEEVKLIAAKLNAGQWVLVEGLCARENMVNAGFIEE